MLHYAGVWGPISHLGGQDLHYAILQPLTASQRPVLLCQQLGLLLLRDRRLMLVQNFQGILLV